MVDICTKDLKKYTLGKPNTSMVTAQVLLAVSLLHPQNEPTGGDYRKTG